MEIDLIRYYNNLIETGNDNTEGIFEAVNEQFKKMLDEIIILEDEDKFALDLGYGYGNYSLLMAGRGFKVDAIDIVNPQLIKNRYKSNPIISKNLNVICLDIRKIQLDKVYDVIIAKDIFHYLQVFELRKLLKKITKHSKKGTRFYFTIFTDITRRNQLGEKYSIENEANLSKSKAINMVNEVFESWQKEIWIEDYKEKEKNNNQNKYYFEANKVSFMLIK